MVINLPSALGELLNMLGFNWPMSNEDTLFDVGTAWMELPGEIDGVLSGAGQHAETMFSENIGDSIEAFKTWWDSEDSPAKLLQDGTVGMCLTGGALMVCAGVVLALKIAVLIQLGILAVQIAAAIAAAAATFGIASAALPALYALGRKIVGDLIQEAVMRLLM
ncbi:hypothetical protein O1R50_18500 [Glycomyces luteolus]|uniref:Outer membrane channel protein CpnT-like N-terminal domain-containing protein n=1 Tax=Glycomyces luteolus TaxID=2670330 RepID=A0A9X3PMU5_9ACTN|nr:hypothetical protein [Glycomyces luteolus]MDA1361625.1 hypothetical protein [Glycomyces luteolus]